MKWICDLLPAPLFEQSRSANREFAHALDVFGAGWYIISTGPSISVLCLSMTFPSQLMLAIITKWWIVKATPPFFREHHIDSVTSRINTQTYLSNSNSSSLTLYGYNGFVSLALCEDCSWKPLSCLSLHPSNVSLRYFACLMFSAFVIENQSFFKRVQSTFWSCHTNAFRRLWTSSSCDGQIGSQNRLGGVCYKPTSVHVCFSACARSKVWGMVGAKGYGWCKQTKMNTCCLLWIKPCHLGRYAQNAKSFFNQTSPYLFRKILRQLTKLSRLGQLSLWLAASTFAQIVTTVVRKCSWIMKAPA